VTIKGIENGRVKGSGFATFEELADALGVDAAVSSRSPRYYRPSRIRSLLAAREEGYRSEQGGAYPHLRPARRAADQVGVGEDLGVKNGRQDLGPVHDAGP
jgi:hypothetical protein